MKKRSMPLPVASVIFGASLICVSSVFAADTHVIGVQGIAWTYKDKKSTSATPLAVDDLKVGDIVEIQIPAGPIHHGFVTIKHETPPPAPPVVNNAPVQACGESKENAALRELDCSGAPSKFGVAFTGSLRLEVTDKFKDPVDFYCVIHKAGMPGVLKLAP